MSQSPPLDNRLLALRAAAQEASDFALGDDQVRRFMALRDAGTGDEEIAAEMGLDAEIVTELVRADEAQAVAHRIAIGELPMYPPPEPGEGVQDVRSGSLAMPLAVLMVVLVGVIVYGLSR
ncbi:MAG TPA: hypothetical protein VGP67_15055 [Gaiellales bacterium]|jgi:hypothetical protein|nr:hypothetical protein [Gaiellales bacterium]